MKKNRSKRKDIGAYVVVIGGLIAVLIALLCHFGLFGGTIEIEIPRPDVAFQIKEMPNNLPVVVRSKEEFKKLDLSDEEKLVFLDVDSSFKVIKIWTIADGKVFFYVEKIEGYPLLTSISDIDVRFLSYINKMQIILRR